MNEITITDESGASGTVTVERSDVAEALHCWFPDAPAEVKDALETLQRQLDRHEHTGETEAYLGVCIH